MHMAKIYPVKPALILLYGFPGAGKTYFARQFCDSVQAAHVHGDRIRAELFESPRYDRQEDAVITQLMDYMSEEFLNAGISVVYDMNAMRARQRLDLREMARKAGATPIAVWFQIDNETAYVRSTKRDRRRADDKYAAIVDRGTFDTVVRGMQNPVSTEEYVVVSGKHTFNTQFTAVAKRMRELGLISIGEDTGHSVKPGLVNHVPNPNAGRVDLTRRNIIIR
jgi:predicted kinase